MTEPNASNADLSALRIDRSRKGNRPGQRSRWWHLLWILVPIILFVAYKATFTKITPALQVRTGTVQLLTGSEAASELVATGYVVAQVKAAVASKATGRLRVLRVEEGDSVKSGEVLAELDNDDMRAALDVARAGLKTARADSLQAVQNLMRQQKLANSKFATQEVLEAATAGYYRAMAEVEAAKANIAAAEVALENTIIRAPFDGTVLTKNADVGEMVAPFASSASAKGAVVTMADMKSLEVEADVSESNINKVVVGHPCEIILDAYPDQRYPGRVKKIIPTADRTRATVMTKVAFTAIDSRVLPEMSARVNFLPPADTTAAAAQPVTAAPSEALTMRDGKQIVFRVVNGITRATPVTVGRKLGNFTEIISGVAVGDIVVLTPPGALESGQKIELPTK
ncbi:MAG: efflux RND transporter periplasmic adaptor subunit [candidate division Zixibacteria bacterium]|nr:efflux RND transporter periplasmic adaptor subunit [candidate division Zixibacteria bacterium]